MPILANTCRRSADFLTPLPYLTTTNMKLTNSLSTFPLQFRRLLAAPSLRFPHSLPSIHEPSLSSTKNQLEGIFVTQAAISSRQQRGNEGTGVADSSTSSHPPFSWLSQPAPSPTSDQPISVTGHGLLLGHCKSIHRSSPAFLRHHPQLPSWTLRLYDLNPIANPRPPKGLFAPPLE